MITLEHIYKTERETLKFRLIALLVILISLYFRKDVIDIWPIVILFTAYMVYAMSLGHFLIPRLKRIQIIYGMILVDAVVANLGLYLAGGVRSYIFVLLPLLVIYYSMFFGYASSLFSATVFSSGYVVTAFLKGDYVAQTPYIAFQVIFLYLASLLSGYLSRRRLQEMQEKVEMQEALHLESQARNLFEIAGRLSSGRYIDLLLEQMVIAATQLFNVSGCLIALYDGDKTNFVVRAGTLDPGEAGVSRLDELILPSLGNGGLGEMLTADSPVSLMNVAQEKIKLPSWIKKVGEKGLLLVPLKTEKEKIGFVILFEKEKPLVLTEEQVHLGQSYADKFSQALADGILHQESQQKIGQIAEDLQYAIRRLDRALKPAGKREVTIGNLHLDGPRGIATYDNKPLELSVTEFELLYILAENAGHPLNSETLLRRVWGQDYSGLTNVVDVGLHRLRRKLERGGAKGLVLTVRGIGYMLADKERSAASTAESPGHGHKTP